MLKNKKGGFSLIELIVVILILGIMTAVLAPVLVHYMERSRAQKDDTLMSEVANSVKIALSQQDVYDELLCYSVFGNVSCYIDSGAESDDMLKSITKIGLDGTKDAYKYEDEYREKEETLYYAAGNMRGLTFTFQPVNIEGDSYFIISDAIVNKFVQKDGNKSDKLKESTNLVASNRNADNIIADEEIDYTSNGTLGTMTIDNTNSCLYNNLRMMHGTKVCITSQTYRNSEYTVFVHLGVLNRTDESQVDPIIVYGQWNGRTLFAIE